jgi:hypothetical protein
MTIEGVVIDGVTGATYYSATNIGDVSYKRNNIPGVTASLYYTFDLGESNINNNYIGDYVNPGGQFILSNNVAIPGWTFGSNTFGIDSCNNSFDDDCTNNRIGDGFSNNITNDDIDRNVIGNFFYNNIITGNMQDNIIGDYFETNLVDGSIYDCRLGNYWNNNLIFGTLELSEISHNFYSNTINNQIFKSRIDTNFYSNVIDQPIENCVIGDSFNNNTITGSFTNNTIGNFFQLNQTLDSGNFDYNSIGHNFAGNTMKMGFYGNQIGNGFADNQIGEFFGYNRIGNGFNNNVIGDYFGFGGGVPQGNVIGNDFLNNTIGDYFYNNIIAERFGPTIIGDHFQLNDIKCYNLGEVDFTENLGNITNITYETPSGTNGVYSSISPTGGSGTGAVFTITVTDDVVSDITIQNSGSKYIVNDQLVVPGEEFGGLNSLIITVSSISADPSVYENYNCQIFENAANFYRLSYFDSNDVLTIKNITE